MTGPLAVYAQSSNVGQDPAVPVGQVIAPVAVVSRAGEACDQDAAYDPDRPCAPAPTLVAAAPVVVTTASWCDPDAAYDPSHPCPRTTAAAIQDVPVAVASRSSLYQPAVPVASVSAPAATAPAALISVTASGAPGRSSWCIQQPGAGARDRRRRSRGTGRFAHLRSDRTFADLRLWREGLSGAPQQLSANAANAACARLAASQQPCMVVVPGRPYSHRPAAEAVPSLQSRAPI